MLEPTQLQKEHTRVGVMLDLVPIVEPLNVPEVLLSHLGPGSAGCVWVMIPALADDAHLRVYKDCLLRHQGQ